MRSYFYKFLFIVFVLGLGGVGLGFFALQTNQYSDLSSRPLVKWSPNLDTPPDLSHRTVKEAHWTETFSRPLFHPTRRPFVPVVDAPEPAASPEGPTPPPEPILVFDPNQLVLKGIMMSSQKSRALITTPDQPGGSWIEPGSMVMGWKVEKVDRNSVLLRANGQSHVLKQYVDNPGERLGTDPANP